MVKNIVLTTPEQVAATIPSDRPILQAKDVVFSYGEKQILNKVSLDIPSGKVLGLLGPNGAGKSTLLGVLTGDLVAQSGQVELAGRPINTFIRRELAKFRSVMPQRSEFPFSYLVRDVVAMGRACWRAENDIEIVDQALRQTDVTHMQDRQITHLSGGESARVTLARVIAQQAQVVFLDEPTAAMDIVHRERTMTLASGLAKQGNAVVAVIHDLQLAASHCDLLALMKDGAIVAFGTPAEVLTEEILTFVYDWPITVLPLPTGEIAIVPRKVEC